MLSVMVVHIDNGESRANFDHYIMDEAGHSELKAMLENARKDGKVITVVTTPGYEGVWIK